MPELAKVRMQNYLQPARRVRSRQRWIALTIAGALGFASCHNGIAQSATAVSSADVEAAYLYNFGKFIDWPSPQSDPASAPFSICIVGKDEFGSTLDSLIQNDTVKGHAIIARHLPSVADAGSCQILFLASSEKVRLAKDLDELKEKPVLTVSSLPGFLEQGGMIQFLPQNNRVRFAVNLAATDHVHLALSSELLKVAVYVSPKPAQEGE
jgi:hypothetical protein